MTCYAALTTSHTIKIDRPQLQVSASGGSIITHDLRTVWTACGKEPAWEGRYNLPPVWSEHVELVKCRACLQALADHTEWALEE